MRYSSLLAIEVCKDTRIKPTKEAELKIIELLDGLTDLQRQVLIYRYGLLDGDMRSLSETAESMGRTTWWVQRQELHSLRLLRTALGNFKFLLNT